MIKWGAVSYVGVGVIAGIALVISFGDGMREGVARKDGRAPVHESAAPIKIGSAVAAPNAPAARVTAMEPTAVITAETDIRQLQSGFLQGAFNWIPLVSGPFVLTDLVATSNSGDLKVVPAADCSAGSPYVPRLPVEQPIHGMRLPVPSGYVACISAPSQNVVWSGFTPY